MKQLAEKSVEPRPIIQKPTKLQQTDTLPLINKNIQPGSLMTVHNDKQLFQNMPGLGPVNVGTEEWNIAKAKQQRMNTYVSKLNQQNKSANSAHKFNR